MMESTYFNNGNFREYSYFAGGNFSVLKREFPVALHCAAQCHRLMNSDDFLSVLWLDGSFYYRCDSKQKIEKISVFLLSLAMRPHAQVEMVPIEHAGKLRFYIIRAAQRYTSSR